MKNATILKGVIFPVEKEKGCQKQQSVEDIKSNGSETCLEEYKPFEKIKAEEQHSVLTIKYTESFC